MDAQTLAKILTDQCPGDKFDRAYWTKAAWNCDAVTVLEMLDYFSKFNSKHWYCFRKVALARGLI